MDEQPKSTKVEGGGSSSLAYFGIGALIGVAVATAVLKSQKWNWKVSELEDKRYELFKT